MFGDELMGAFSAFKALWDPGCKMNPGKVVGAYPVDVNLRWGKQYDPWEPQTHFSFRDDDGSFAYAANRCVGTGACRKTDEGTMCPSYMVTREEKHSTRGRARLLFEMLQGDPLRGGWQNESVKDALDLCLSCKGCKSECPVNVDMATYKAEFLSHYYSVRRRPAGAYAFGLIMYWGHLASFAPWLANAVTQKPILRDIAKRAAGIAPQRRIPAFAPRTFKSLLAQWPRANPNGPPLVLWADTFNNYFHPQTALAAVRVLEAEGYRVIVPKATLCCGRPLYDYGMLDLAKTFLQRALQVLRPHIEAGTPVVGLEPSCISVFRDEMSNLLPNEKDAERLRTNSFLLSEFLAKKAGYEPPALSRKAVLHGHCHHKAIFGMDDEVKLLKKMGLELDVLDSGCCGMAGAFGFEAGDRYEVSMKAAERVLLPKVRASALETLLITDGFSCREQIGQTTARGALHFSEVLDMAMRYGPSGVLGACPERRYLQQRVV
jgi:Fe-S oxidoreductase